MVILLTLLLGTAQAAEYKKLGASYGVCGEIIVYSLPQAFKLDPFTGQKSFLKDGVYETRAHCDNNGTCKDWCIYKIIKGFPEEVD